MIKKFVQYSEGDYILCMMSRLFVAIHSIDFFHVAHIDDNRLDLIQSLVHTKILMFEFFKLKSIKNILK
jgi:hypothetical protein